VVQVTALSFLLTAILDWLAARASRAARRADVSQTLGGTLATRAAARCIAWLLVHPPRGRATARPR
jgi:hypothetical protein